MTLVDRTTSCILGWAVAPERTTTLLQNLVDQGSPGSLLLQ
jgi:hypothetical protein